VFSDMQGFGDPAGRLDPEQLTSLLNAYLDWRTRIHGLIVGVKVGSGPSLRARSCACHGVARIVRPFSGIEAR
jgi:hypothetical protein